MYIYLRTYVIRMRFLSPCGTSHLVISCCRNLWVQPNEKIVLHSPSCIIILFYNILAPSPTIQVPSDFTQFLNNIRFFFFLLFIRLGTILSLVQFMNYQNYFTAAALGASQDICVSQNYHQYYFFIHSTHGIRKHCIPKFEYIIIVFIINIAVGRAPVHISRGLSKTLVFCDLVNHIYDHLNFIQVVVNYRIKYNIIYYSRQ